MSNIICHRLIKRCIFKKQDQVFWQLYQYRLFVEMGIHTEYIFFPQLLIIYCRTIFAVCLMSHEEDLTLHNEKRKHISLRIVLAIALNLWCNYFIKFSLFWCLPEFVDLIFGLLIWIFSWIVECHLVWVWKMVHKKQCLFKVVFAVFKQDLFY